MRQPSQPATPTAELDSVTHLASEILHAPIAMLSRVDEDEEVLMSSWGLPASRLRKSGSPLPAVLGGTIARTGTALLIDNLLEYDIEADESEAGWRLVSYAGVPIQGEDHRVLGVLSVVDRIDRHWTPQDQRLLTELADLAASARTAPPPLESESAGSSGGMSLERYRGLVEQSLAGVYLIQDDRFRYVNPRLAEIFGYSREEILEKVRPADLVVPAHRARVRANMRRRLTGEWDGVRYGFRGLKKGGKTIDAVVLGNRVDVDGRPALIGTLLDVTERRKAVRSLRRSEERYRMVSHAGGNALRDWNLRTGSCLWSGASVPLLRYSPREIGTDIAWWHERIHPEDREQVITDIHAALDSTPVSWRGEYRFRKGDGTYAVFLDCCYIARDKRGVARRVVGALTDISERRRAESMQRFLTEASDLLQDDLELQPTLASVARLAVPTLADYCLIDLVEGEELVRVGLAHVDPDREKMLRARSRQTLDGDPRRHPVIRALTSREAVLVTECTPELLLSISHDADHHRKLVEMALCSFMVVPLVAHQKALGVITLASSVSERRFTPRDLMVAEELAHRAALAIEHATLYRAARQAVQARDEVLAVVSHDLRNPLHTLKLSASFLQEDLEDRRKSTLDALDIIRRTVDQMNRMVGDLLDVSKIEAGSFSVTPQPTEISLLIEDVRTLLEPLAAARRLRLSFSVAADLRTAHVDAEQILRVFSNLVGNAIKFTPEEGEVTVCAEPAGEEVLFRVVDTGPGIAADLLPHVFDRFWQAREGDNRGAGLGLAIARGIVEAHGGRLWGESELQQGATFSFTVPLSMGSACSAPGGPVVPLEIAAF
jgi:PAS domain S-box-containing protein